MSLVFLAAALLTARGGPEAGVSGAPGGRSDRLTHAGGPPLGEWLGRKIFGHFWVCDQRVRHGDRLSAREEMSLVLIDKSNVFLLFACSLEFYDLLNP